MGFNIDVSVLLLLGEDGRDGDDFALVVEGVVREFLIDGKVQFLVLRVFETPFIVLRAVNFLVMFLAAEEADDVCLIDLLFAHPFLEGVERPNFL